MIVKHSSFCDYIVSRPAGKVPIRCLASSGNYSRWPNCESCSDHCCYAHRVPGSLNEELGTCLCRDCGDPLKGDVA